MSKKVLINCDEATAICNKNQYKEASSWDKVKLSMHIFLCKKCRLYSEQNTFMTKLFGAHTQQCGEQKLSDEEKDKLKNNLAEIDK